MGCMTDPLLDAEPRIADALAAAAGTTPGSVEVAVGAVSEREAAGEAAGGLDAQPLGTPLQAPFDVPEVR